MFQFHSEAGQGLAEVAVAGAILCSVLAVVAAISAIGLRSLTNAQIREEATTIAQQGIEVMKNFRDRNWGAVESVNPGDTNCASSATCSYSLATPGQEPYLDYGRYTGVGTNSGCNLPAGSSALGYCDGRFYAIGVAGTMTEVCLWNDTVGGGNNYKLSTVLTGLLCAQSAYPTAGANFRRRVFVTDANGHPAWNLSSPGSVTSCGQSYQCNVRKVVVRVTWNGDDNCTSPQTCVTLTAYLSKWKEPAYS